MFEGGAAQPPSGRPGEGGDEVAQLLDVEGLVGSQRSERLRELELLQSRLDSARLALLQRWDADVEWSADGSSSGAVWLAPRVGISGAHARERIKVARWLRDAHLVEKSLEAGTLTWAKVALFARFVTEDCLERFEQDQHWLVSSCEQLRVEHCSRFLRYWASHADPDGADDDDSARWEHRSLMVAEAWDGMGDLRANLTPEALLRFNALLDRVCDELYREEDEKDPAHVERTSAQRRHDAFVEILRRAAAWDEQQGNGTRPSFTLFLDYEATRTRAADEARRAERDRARWQAWCAQHAGKPPAAGATSDMNDAAGVDMSGEAPTGDGGGAGAGVRGDSAGRASGHAGHGPASGGHDGGEHEHAATDHPGAGTRSGPHGTDQQGGPTAKARGPAPPGEGGQPTSVRTGCCAGQDPPDPPEQPDPPDSALAAGWDGPVITRKQAHQWLCEADVARLLIGPDGEVLDHGRSQRLYTAPQRRAIIRRQGGECIWLDCDRPAGWLQVHHLDEWDRDRGRTDLDRGVAACTFHHHRIHDAGFSIQGDAGTGALTFHRPDGSEITVDG